VIGRIVIDDIRPRTPTGQYPAKAALGEVIRVRAAIFKDGHDVLAARAHLFRRGQRQPEQTVGMAPLGNDLWEARLEPRVLGPHRVVVEAWTDRHATWAARVRVRLDAGQDIGLEIAEGVAILGSGADRAGADPALVPALSALGDTLLPPERRVAPALAVTLDGPDGAADLTQSTPARLLVDRERALVGAWYELFPRSHGGLAGTAKRLPAVAAMGFDVLYLPPIHPIGTTDRKGRNNALRAAPGDPGSPWAIGNAEGGHTAIDRRLGNFEDFAIVLDAAAEHGMEIAMDYALQCSPDHPWVREHPEWFYHRLDGTIAFAENPPKKYQDIYPINFWPEHEVDRVALWHACLEILEFWIERGVRIFRVDNPHTKPMQFWEWLIPQVQRDHPDAVLLAEAFTRPRVMAKLAEVGFNQSYTYFTWRTEQHGHEGLRAYLEELSGPLSDFMRPNFWPNTPDILSGPLRRGGPPAFASRLVLAVTMSPSWGMYSGYELYENEPASEDNEEYLYSEKYETKERDFDQHGTLVPLVTRLNEIRRAHPALQRLRSIRFHDSTNPQILVYSKVSDDGLDVMLMVVNLDPVHMQEATLSLDLAGLGLDGGDPYRVVDQLTGEVFVWQGAYPYVRLEPWVRVAHVFSVPDAGQRVAPGGPAA
jgi:starch synthase (maltosyl-transferring)